jgi:hypothetical protein
VTDRAVPRSSPSWQLFLGLLGASAGLTFVLYAVGDVVEARRFETLVLPGAQTVAPLSHDSSSRSEAARSGRRCSARSARQRSWSCSLP